MLRYEARLIAQRMTAQGPAITLLIHDDDADKVLPALIKGGLGQPYAVQMAAMDYDNPPTTQPDEPPALPPTTQAEIAEGEANRKGRQTVQDAAVLARNADFQLWSKARNEDEAAAFIRDYCGIDSRKELANNNPARKQFHALHGDFLKSLQSQQEDC